MKGSFLDYVVIVLLAAGVVLLGVDELTRSSTIERLAEGKSSDKSVLGEIREDLSTQLTEGVPVEKLAPQTEDDMKARYPWEVKSTAEEDGKGRQSLTARIKSLFSDSDEESKKD